MKLTDFFFIASSKKKLLIITTIITALVLIVPTILLLLASRSLSASLRIQSSILLLTPSTTTTDSGYSLSVSPILPADRLDDKAAVDYLQNNKAYWKNSGITDYASLAQKVSDQAFINSIVNSSDFKNHLKNDPAFQNHISISIVEQNDSISVKLSGRDADDVLASYNKMRELLPAYLNTAIKNTLTTATEGLTAIVSNDSLRVDQLLGEYSALKAETGFTDIVSYNKATAILNSVSAISGNISANTDTLQKLTSVLNNNLSPTVLVKSYSDQGLSPTKSMVPYLIIELIAALLIGCLVVFLSAFSAKVKAAQRG